VCPPQTKDSPVGPHEQATPAAPETARLRTWILFAHLVGLPLALGAGLGLCGRDLGWSDSLVIARSPVLSWPRPSVLEYVSSWYTHLNGRLSQAVVASLVRLPFSGASTPEEFPFWAFAGLSFLCVALTIILVGSSVARVARSARAGGLVAFLLAALWATNPVSFENITFHHLAIFLAYLLRCGSGSRSTSRKGTPRALRSFFTPRATSSSRSMSRSSSSRSPY
jgi:hypothetical protein